MKNVVVAVEKRKWKARDFVPIVFGLLGMALAFLLLAYLVEHKSSSPEEQAHQATMREQLLTTTPGDLAVMEDGLVVVLGAGGRPGVVYGNEIYYTTADFGEHSRFLDVFANNVDNVVKVGSPEHGGYASCFVLKRPVIVVNSTPMCQ